jgi:RNA polymerase sigma-70 factor (ECF subfamily)
MAWDCLVELYSPLVYKWTRQQGITAQDARDIGQEVFAAVAKNLDRFHHDQPGDTFAGWLRAITANKIRDHWRSVQNRPRATGGSEAHNELNQLPFEESASEAGADTKATFLRILSYAQDRIDPQHWEVFWRVVVDGHEPAEVAADVGITREYVYIIKSRVLRRLRDIFEDDRKE